MRGVIKDAAVSTSTFLILPNVSMTANERQVQLTVGRATVSGASNAASTNITNRLSPLTLPVPGSFNYYMAALKVGNNIEVNLSGSSLDSPGSGTFYYTIWMQASNSSTYAEMAVSLVVLQVVP
jgi:hypothetical protein